MSRTKTFGKIGVSNGLFYEKHLKFIRLNQRPVEFTKLDLSYLERQRYDREVMDQVERMPVVTLEELQSGAAAKKHKVRNAVAFQIPDLEQIRTPRRKGIIRLVF